MSKSQQLFDAAQQHIPGGVNSPVRAFKGVGGSPIFFSRGEGAYLFDADGQRYVDYVGSWGPMIGGHCHPDVVRAVQETAANGLGFGAPTEIETRMADLLCELVPSLDMVRMVSSGTEATMSAIRLARGFTGRDKIVKFEGCYHGHSDSLLVKAGSGALTLGVPTSPGRAGRAGGTHHHPRIQQCRPGASAFAEYRRADCRHYCRTGGRQHELHPTGSRVFWKLCARSATDMAAVLIFDEVMTGFRVALGGAQSYYGVTPGSHHARQGGRWRPAGGRLRWQARHHGTDRADRAGVSGRYAVRQPGRDGGRSGHAEAGQQPGFHAQLEQRQNDC